MASREFRKGAIIENEGNGVSALHIILQGSVKATFSGGEIILKKGDVIGLYDLAFDTHSFTYTAEDTTTLLSFPIKGSSSVKDLCSANPEISKMFYTSMVNEMIYVLAYYAKLKNACEELFNKGLLSYKEYSEICSKNGIVPRSLPQFDNYSRLNLETDVADWLLGYYASHRDFPEAIKSSLPGYPSYIYGFLIRASEDVHSAFSACEDMVEYRNEKMSLFLQENSIDLFDLYTSVLFRLSKNSSDFELVSKSIDELIDYIKSHPGIDSTLIHERVSMFLVKRQSLSSDAPKEEDSTSKSLEANLHNSLDMILEYSGVDSELADRFRGLISKYKKLEDKTSVDEASRRLRNELTQCFYELYTEAFVNTADDYTVPTLLKMFFNFGYVDEDLAGHENANYLYQIADTFEGDSTFGVYTIREWLIAVYEKRKEPSRNEFDTDFLSFLHEQKVAGKITAEEEASYSNDGLRRLRFEIENMFPIVNKISYGRISIFTPIFCEHNVIKPLHSCLVTTDNIFESIRKILAIDYGAFNRETIYTNDQLKIGKEYISIKILPDIILAPNVGTRGVMWQEIEGKRRTTPARFVLSVFHLEELQLTLTRLVGEFRWEMCKRIQGGRWNDVSDRSLTSEYFDYAQFYKKNSDLSPEAKEKVKQALARSNNSFKEMFVRDYVTWVLFEGSGSPRLNKVARNILATYCPFSKSLRTSMAANPLYKELLERYEIKTAQKLHHIDNVIQKINFMGGNVPPEILATRLFIEGK